MSSFCVGYSRDYKAESQSTIKSGIPGIAGDKAVRSDKDTSNALQKTWAQQQVQH